MDDIQLFENFHDTVCLYCKENGFTGNIDRDSFSLVDYGDNNIIISEWNLNIPKPTKEQLKGYSLINVKKYQTEKAKIVNKKLIHENSTYCLIERLCLKLKINIDDLINEI